MADSISGFGGGTSQAITGRNSGSIRKASATASSTDTPAPLQRRVVNLDGESFDLTAKRGTYVDMYA